MIKRFAVAAVVVLFAFSAMATNFRVADQVYIPAAGHIAGSSGTFLTDVFLSNLENFPVTVSVIFSQGTTGSQTTFNNLITMQANERKEIVDFISAPASAGGLGLSSGFGQVVLNGCKTGATCSDDASTFANYARISAESRTYSIPVGASPTAVPAPATTGQLFSGFPWYNYASEEQSTSGLNRVFMVGVRQTGVAGTAGTYRTNIGFSNASQFGTTTIQLKLFAGNGTQLGNTYAVGLGALGNGQVALNAAFPTVNFAGQNAMWVTAEQTGSSALNETFVPDACKPKGCPGFFAYGSMLDNVSGDATTLEPQYFQALTDAAIACIYPSTTQTTTCKGTPTIRRSVRH